MSTTQTTDTKGGDVLSTAETCRLLGCSRPTLYKMMSEGRIAPVPGNPVLMIQKRNYFRRADVERIVREGRPRKRAASASAA